MTMKPICVYTLNELKRISPNITEDIIKSKDPKVKEKLHLLYWTLGCDISQGIEIQRGHLTKNRFGEVDDSIRTVVAERTDDEWVFGHSKYASQAAKEFTEDQSLHIEMYHMKRGGNAGVVDYSHMLHNVGD